MLEWGGPLVEVLEHDGHASGHAALHLPGDGVLVAGDRVSDVEVPLLDLKSGAPDPLGDYEGGLTVLEHVQERGCRVGGTGAWGCRDGWRGRDAVRPGSVVPPGSAEP